MSEHQPSDHQDQAGDPFAAREARMEALAEQYLDQLQAGQSPNRQALLVAHPDLADLLRQRLAVVDAMHGLARAEKERGGSAGSINDPPRQAASAKSPVFGGVPDLAGTTDEPPLPPASGNGQDQLSSPAHGERGLRLKCPHCGNRIQLVEPEPREVTCLNCGSSFQVEPRSTTSYHPDQLPKSIGKFQILERLGRGAFGTVYKARDPELERTVAVKVPRTGYFHTPEEEERFLREARSAAQLNHPGIVKVLEIAHERGVPYIVSDYVAGLTLADLLTGSRPSFRESAELVAHLAEALEYAHRAKVVHRDIKPSNILLDESRSPHLTDFGLARRDEGEITMTLDGQILGTPAYMSPEQARGETHSVDARTDIYSLGVVLYELLTGELPFRGNKRMVLHQVLHDEPRAPRRLNDRIPRDLETICLKALSKTPDHRYASAGSLAQDLQRFLKGEPIQARPVGNFERLRRWCRRNPTLATTAGLAVVALVTIMVLSIAFAVHQSLAAKRLDGEQQRTKAALIDAEEQRNVAGQNADLLRLEQQQLASALKEAQTERTFSQRRVAELALERGLAYCELGDAGLGMLWLARSLETAAKVPQHEVADLQRYVRTQLVAWRDRLSPLKGVLQAQEDLSMAAYSPDGQTIWTAGNESVQRWEADTGKAIGQPLRLPGIRAIAFRPDDKILVAGTSKDVLRLWDAATGQSIGRPMEHPEFIMDVAFSPDGKTLLTGCYDRTARLWDTASGKPLDKPFQHEDPVGAVVFSSDGKLLATGTTTGTITGKRGAVQLWNAKTGKPRGSPLSHEHAVHVVAFSPDARIIASGSYDRSARLWETASGNPLGQPLEHQVSVDGLVFSPDGRLVLTAGRVGARLWDWVTGKPLAQPFPHRGAKAVAFSPDGRTFLTGDRQGTIRFWDTALVRNAGKPIAHEDGVKRVAFSPDARIILSTTWGDTAHRWEAATGRAIGNPIHFPHGPTSIALSPDGKKIAIGNHSASHAQLWDAATGQRIGTPMEHPGSVYAVAFSPDSSTVLVGGVSGAQLWDVATGKPRGTFLQHGHVDAVGFSPDGKTIVTGGKGGAELWRTTTGESLGPPLGDKGWISAAAISSDGQTVLTGGDDWTVRLWDITTRKPRGPARHLQAHGDLEAMAFSSDGRLVVTGGSDGTVRLWEAATGRPLSPLHRQKDSIQGAAFSPDGRFFLTGSKDGTARLWSVPMPMPGGVERIVLWTQVSTGMELDENGVAHLLEPAAWQQRRQRLATQGESPITPGDDHRLWHQREAKEGELDGQWSAALWHLDRLIGKQPGDSALRESRARAYAELGQWDKAVAEYAAFELRSSHPGVWQRRGIFFANRGEWAKATADLAKAMTLDPSNPQIAFQNAVALLWLGSNDEYRRSCAKIIASLDYDRMSNDGLLKMMEICTLVPGAVADYRRLIQLCEKVVADNPKRCAPLHVLGPILYRAGNFEAAINRLNDATRLHHGVGRYSDWVFLAMAHHRSGHKEEAQQWLEKAVRWLDQQESANDAYSWDTSLDDRLLRREAEAMILGKPAP